MRGPNARLPGLRWLGAAFAIAGLDVLLLASAGLSPVLVHAAALGGLALGVLALPQGAERPVPAPESEPSASALVRA